jgi:hypothetical protein
MYNELLVHVLYKIKQISHNQAPLTENVLINYNKLFIFSTLCPGTVTMDYHLKKTQREIIRF